MKGRVFVDVANDLKVNGAVAEADLLSTLWETINAGIWRWLWEHRARILFKWWFLKIFWGDRRIRAMIREAVGDCPFDWRTGND